jgi:FkbM family methyltransferase
MIDSNMTTYGTSYGGWKLPHNTVLDNTSVVLSAGVGEDISFDLAIQSKFGCQVHLIDPTDRAIRHVEEVKQYYSTGIAGFSGDIQKDYQPYIKDLKPDFSKIHMHAVGLWDKSETLKFYKQTNPKYVSQTLIPEMFGQEYTSVPVVRLSSLLDQIGLSGRPIALLKMDIEGAEIEVLESLIEDKIYPQLLCVEFDYLLKGRDKTKRTETVIDRLCGLGYKIISNEKWNVVFELAS